MTDNRRVDLPWIRRAILRHALQALALAAVGIAAALAALLDLGVWLAARSGVAPAVVAGGVVPLAVAMVLLGVDSLRERRLQHRSQRNLIQTNRRLRQSAADLARFATFDSLTGLYNRRAWLEALEQEWRWSERYGTAPAVVMIDLDRFKEVNDRGGHAAGDAVLRAFAESLGETLRSSDIMGRLGGDEFAVLLPEADSEDARVVAEKIRACFSARRLDFAAGPIALTLSAGIACGRSEQVREAQDLVRIADEALYDAKVAGRNRVVVAADERTAPLQISA